MLLLAVTDGQMDRQNIGWTGGQTDRGTDGRIGVGEGRGREERGELVAQMMNITFDGRMEGQTDGQQTDSGQTKGWTNGPKDK